MHQSFYTFVKPCSTTNLNVGTPVSSTSERTSFAPTGVRLLIRFTWLCYRGLSGFGCFNGRDMLLVPLSVHRKFNEAFSFTVSPVVFSYLWTGLYLCLP